MYYHFAILMLFRPFIRYRIIGSGVCPRNVCSQAADAIEILSTSYSRLYTLQRTPTFAPYFVLASVIVRLDLGGVCSHTHAPSVMQQKSADPQISKALEQSIIHLREMAKCHTLAGQALDILFRVSEKWNDGQYNLETGDHENLPSVASSNIEFAPEVGVEAISTLEDSMMRHWGISLYPNATGRRKGPFFCPNSWQKISAMLTNEELQQAGFTLL